MSPLSQSLPLSQGSCGCRWSPRCSTSSCWWSASASCVSSSSTPAMSSTGSSSMPSQPSSRCFQVRQRRQAGARTRPVLGAGTVGPGTTLGLSPGCSIQMHLGQSLLFSEPRCYNLYIGIVCSLTHSFSTCLRSVCHVPGTAAERWVVLTIRSTQLPRAGSIPCVAERRGLA